MNESEQLLMIMTTLESAGDADQLATEIVSQSLAACVQIDGPITSHYRWGGQLTRATEFRLMIKTSRTAWPRLRAKLSKLHPYDEPGILVVAIEETSEGYGKWVIDQTT